MNKRVIYIGIIYSVAVIIFKLAIIFTGNQLTKFGFFYSHMLTVFAVIPFMFIAVKLVRDKDMGGVITGKQALTAGMGVVAIGMIILSIYNYIEFELVMKDMSIQYYHSNDYLEFLKTNKAVKVEEYPKIIESQIKDLSAAKAMTAKLFSLLLIGLSSAFMCGVFLRKSA
jgi:hypothetical protein